MMKKERIDELNGMHPHYFQVEIMKIEVKVSLEAENSMSLMMIYLEISEEGAENTSGD